MDTTNLSAEEAAKFNRISYGIMDEDPEITTLIMLIKFCTSYAMSKCEIHELRKPLEQF